MKGNIMLRMHLDMTELNPLSWKQANHYPPGICIHHPTNLLMVSCPQGFYIEDKGYAFGDVLVVRPDMPAIREVSMLEIITNDCGLIAVGCGKFISENGTVKISERSGHPGCLQVEIVANSINNFNATVQALRNGELVPAGSEQTVAENLHEKVESLKRDCDILGNLLVEEKKITIAYEPYVDRCRELEFFILSVTASLSGVWGENSMSTIKTGDSLLEHLKDQVVRINKIQKTFWYNYIYQIPPVFNFLVRDKKFEKK